MDRPAAPNQLIIVIVIVWQNVPLETCLRFLLHQNAVALGGCLARVLRLLNLSDQELEGLADVLVVSCARLGPAALNLFGELLSIFRSDLSLLGSQVALVADNADRNGVSTLDDEILVSLVEALARITESTHQVVKNLLTNDLHHLERRQ